MCANNVAGVTRRARAKYHKTVKQVKWDQNIIRRNKMAESISYVTIIDHSGVKFVKFLAIKTIPCPI